MPSYQVDPVAEARPVPARLGRYELIGQLATGGMAEIHLARLAGEAGFEKIVVVKRLLPELVSSQAFVSMFLDEGKLVARLDHPNVCEVHELGRDGSEYFLAMPYLDGVSVHDLISRPREPDRIAELRICAGVTVQACAGLHHAHELRDADGGPAGLVHRDVSPSNLFVTITGVVKVLDFGIAKVRGAAETEAGTIKGKTQYMAPEQLLGEPLDRRCDVFALGIVMFELATHQRLFKRASDYLAARAILEEPIPRADEVDPAIPTAVADVIARALARDRDARYADAAELARALETVMVPHGGIAGASAIASVVTSTDELTAQRTRQARVIGEAKSKVAAPSELSVTRPLQGEKTTVMPRPASKRGWLVGAIALLAVGTTVFVVTRDRSSTEQAVATRDGSLTERTEGTRDDSSTERTVASAPDAGTDAHAMVVAAVDAGMEANVVRADAAVASPHAGDDSTPRVAKRGTINIDSTPFATIYIDSKRVDVTPLLNHSLSAGRHRIRAVLKDGRAKDFVVEVPAGKPAKPITLTW